MSNLRNILVLLLLLGAAWASEPAKRETKPIASAASKLETNPNVSPGGELDDNLREEIRKKRLFFSIPLSNIQVPSPPRPPPPPPPTPLSLPQLEPTTPPPEAETTTVPASSAPDPNNHDQLILAQLQRERERERERPLNDTVGGKDPGNTSPSGGTGGKVPWSSGSNKFPGSRPVGQGIGGGVTGSEEGQGSIGKSPGSSGGNARPIEGGNRPNFIGSSGSNLPGLAGGSSFGGGGYRPSKQGSFTIGSGSLSSSQEGYHSSGFPQSPTSLGSGSSGSGFSGSGSLGSGSLGSGSSGSGFSGSGFSGSGSSGSGTLGSGVIVSSTPGTSNSGGMPPSSGRRPKPIGQVQDSADGPACKPCSNKPSGDTDIKEIISLISSLLGRLPGGPGPVGRPPTNNLGGTSDLLLDNLGKRPDRFPGAVSGFSSDPLSALLEALQSGSSGKLPAGHGPLSGILQVSHSGSSGGLPGGRIPLPELLETLQSGSSGKLPAGAGHGPLSEILQVSHSGSSGGLPGVPLPGLLEAFQSGFSGRLPGGRNPLAGLLHSLQPGYASLSEMSDEDIADDIDSEEEDYAQDPTSGFGSSLSLIGRPSSVLGDILSQLGPPSSSRPSLSYPTVGNRPDLPPIAVLLGGRPSFGNPFDVVGSSLPTGGRRPAPSASPNSILGSLFPSLGSSGSLSINGAAKGNNGYIVIGIPIPAIDPKIILQKLNVGSRQPTSISTSGRLSTRYF